MKEYFIKRESIIRLLSLAIIAVSVFLANAEFKIALLSLGILGLMTLSWYKGQKTSFYIFLVLFILGIFGYYLILTGRWELPVN